MDDNITDNVDCILLELGQHDQNNADIADFTASVILQYGEGKVERKDFGLNEIYYGEFSIVVMEGDNIVADCFYRYEIFPGVDKEPQFGLKLIVDPKGYQAKYIHALYGIASNLVELNQVFEQFIYILVNDLHTKRD